LKKIFTTSRGSVELEERALFIKDRKYFFQETGFARILWNALPLILLISLLFLDYDPFRFFVRTVLYLIWTIDRLPTLYRLVIKTSFSKRIPLDNIVSTEIREDANDLETHVLLHLKNNRTRTITFRKLEKQYEAFLEDLPVTSKATGLA
jgi:hypothetical protein